MADVLNGCGHTLTLVGRSEDAGKVLDERLNLAHEIKNDTNVTQALAIPGERFFYAGDFKSAKPLFEQALQARWAPARSPNQSPRTRAAPPSRTAPPPRPGPTG